MKKTLTYLPKNPALQRAMKAAIFAAGEWSQRFDDRGTGSFPFVPAGIRALRRAGRPDLIPTLARRCNTFPWTVPDLETARHICSYTGPR